MTSFPNTLLQLINSESFPNAIGWGPNGCIWIDPKAFQQHVLKVHFQGVNKFASFVRKLNRYGFRKVIESEGSPVDSARIVRYQHDSFRPGISHAMASMIRIQRRGLVGLRSNGKPVPAAAPQRKVATQPSIQVHQGETRTIRRECLNRGVSNAERNSPSSILLQGLLKRQYCDRMAMKALCGTVVQPHITSPLGGWTKVLRSGRTHDNIFPFQLGTNQRTATCIPSGRLLISMNSPAFISSIDAGFPRVFYPDAVYSRYLLQTGGMRSLMNTK